MSRGGHDEDADELDAYMASLGEQAAAAAATVEEGALAASVGAARRRAESMRGSAAARDVAMEEGVDRGGDSSGAGAAGASVPGARAVDVARIVAAAAQSPLLAVASVGAQRVERDPTAAEVEAELRALIDRDPGIFLERHGAVLSDEDLESLGRAFVGSQAVQYHVSAILGARRATDAAQLLLVRNRRFVAMKRLAEEGYFSLSSMRERAPDVYESIVGRVAGEAARRGDPASEMPLTDMLFARLDAAPDVPLAAGEVPRVANGNGAPAGPVGGTTAPDADMDGTRDSAGHAPPDATAVEAAAATVADAANALETARRAQAAAEGAYSGPGTAGGAGAGAAAGAHRAAADDAELAALHEEFAAAMRVRFLEGGDAASFDYAVVDTDGTLDVSPEAIADAEEAWFDAM